MKGKKRTILWIGIGIAVIVAALVRYQLMMDEYELENEDITAHVYRVEEISYESPECGCPFTLENAPLFEINAIRKLRVCYDKSTDEWKTLGELYESPVVVNNFDMQGGAPELLDNYSQSWATQNTQEETGEFYNLILQEDSSLYLGWGDAMSARIGWVVKLSRVDTLQVSVNSFGMNTLIIPEWYPEGSYDQSTENMNSGTIQRDGSIVFTMEGVDTLTVQEAYYACPSENDCVIEEETYTLEKNKNGQFVMDVARRNDIQQEYAVYRIPYENGEYIFMVKYQ